MFTIVRCSTALRYGELVTTCDLCPAYPDHEKYPVIPWFHPLGTNQPQVRCFLGASKWKIINVFSVIQTAA